MPKLRHAAAIRRTQRRIQGVDDPPATAFATLPEELKGFRHPPFFKPLMDDQMHRW